MPRRKAGALILGGCALAFAALAPLPAQARAAGAAIRDTLHPYRPGVDVLHYDIAIDLPDSGNVIRGSAAVTVRRTAPVDTLVLDLLGLTVQSVDVFAGETDANVRFVRESATVRVPLPRGTGDTLVVTVRYGGPVTDGLIARRDSLGRWTYFGDNWPNRARHWIPSVDHPSDKATVTWTVNAPSDRRVVANGVLVEETPLASSGGAPAFGALRTRTVWRESKPISVYLMVIAAAPLAYVDLGESACGRAERPGCVPQAVYAFPEVRPTLPGPFARAPEMLDFYARLVGPFPYEKLAHLQSATRFGGMENATAIFYSDRAFREGTLDEGLIAHETAHQWFGDAVTEREWAHLWLSEGFATYFAQLWWEHARGDTALVRGMRALRDQIIASEVTARRPVIDTAETNYLQLLNTNSYQKGGWVLHMLRDLVGDSAFFRGVRSYYARYRHGTALTDDFRREVERASGRSLGWFFDQWLRRPGHADVTTRWSYDAGQGRVFLDVEQGGRWPPYRFPLAIEIRDANGRVRRTRVEVAAARTQRIALPLSLPLAPHHVTLDPDVRVLARFTAR